MKRRSWYATAGVLAVTAGAVVTLPEMATGATTTTSIQDTARGTGLGQVQFSAGWSQCTTTCAKASDKSYVWTSAAGSSATVRFSGRRIRLYGVKEPWSLIATVSIDGKAAVDVDEYAATATATSVQVYASPTLAEGTHTLVMTVTGRRNPASTGGSSVTFDRAVVQTGSGASSSPTTPATTTPVTTTPATTTPGTTTPVTTTTTKPTTTTPVTTTTTTTTKTTTPPTTTTKPATGLHASGLPWSDGGFFMHDSAKATAFATWRGRPIDNIVAFTSRDTWANLLNDWWKASLPAGNGFVASRDDFILSVPLWTDDGSAGTDTDWKTLASEFAAVDPNGYIRLGWEMNCCFSHALAGSEAAWTTQFSRAVTLMKSVAPNIRIVFNPNEGASAATDPAGHALVPDVSKLFVPGKVDVIALDAYDWWPAYTTTAAAEGHFTKTYGWNWWYDFARSKGLPFALGEFSVYKGSSASGGDNPAFFTSVYNWLSTKETATPGSIAFVSLFNDTASYCLCAVLPTTDNPAAAARYKTIINSLAG